MIQAQGTIRALHDHVIVQDMNFGERVSRGGIILRSDDAKTHGIRPRWAKVYAIGHEQQDVKIGDWILIEHGRWTRGVKLTTDNGETLVVRRVDAEAIMAISDSCPDHDDTIGNEV